MTGDATDQPWHADYAALIEQANDAGETGTRIPFLLAAAELADAHHDVDRAYEARDDLITAAIFGGRVPEALAAFAWCLGALDRDPDRLALSEAEAAFGGGLYWKFKWIIDDAPDLAAIPRDSLEAMYADMCARFRRLGLGAHAIEDVASGFYWALGEETLALEYAGRALTLAHDELSDCAACTAHGTVWYHLQRDDLDAALKAGERILAGTMRCNSVPKGTYAALLVPLLAAGKGELARTLVKKLLRQLKNDESDVGRSALAIRFLALTGNHARAWGTFTRYAVHAAALGAHEAAWSHAVAGEELVRCLARAGQDSIHGAIPVDFFGESFAEGHGDGARTWPVAALARACAARADALTAAFDQRNRNRTYSERRAKRLAAVERLACELPLNPPGAADAEGDPPAPDGA